LVTLLGPGGIGKTRLTVEFARRVAPTWDDGVWMVDLAALPAAQPIDFAVAETLGVVVSADAGPADSVVEHLRSRRALLILDNCEHVLPGARDVTRRVLADCPGTAFLATSRERLGIGGEHSVVVEPLPLTDECIDLFVDRATGRDGSFHVDGGDRAVMLDICRRLDGMPLGIELAAARANVLSPAEILESLGHRLASLGRRDDVLTARQRTLRGLLDWSYDLLDTPEQAVFRRLSVFTGTFDLATAAAAVGHGEVDGDDVAEIVWSLVDKSLVSVERTEGSTRYRLLETIRAVTTEYSDSAGDAAPTRRALGERYLADFPLDSNGNREWRARLALEQRTVIELIDPLIADGVIELAHALARLGVSLIGHQTAAREALRVILPLIADGRPRSRGSARLEALAAELLAGSGDLVAAEAHLASGRRLLEQFGDHDRHGLVMLSPAQGLLSLRDGSDTALQRAESELRSVLERPLPPARRVDALLALALVSQTRGDSSARDYLSEVVEITERSEDHTGRMAALNNLAEDELRCGEVAAAAGHQRDSLRLSVELGLPLFTAFGLILAGRIAQPFGLDAVAVRLHAAADAVLDDQGFALLSDDRALSDAMLAATRATLGDDGFAAELAAGRVLDLPELLRTADEVFEQAMRTP
jgi:predicted ATPase